MRSSGCGCSSMPATWTGACRTWPRCRRSSTSGAGRRPGVAEKALGTIAGDRADDAGDGVGLPEDGTEYIVGPWLTIKHAVPALTERAGGSISAEFAPKAADAGCVVVDNTSHFRYDDDIPLVVPEVNPEAIGDYRARGIIANPNCSTIQMVVALKPIYDAAGIERINVCTYQAVSGAGRSAIEELVRQATTLLNLQTLCLACHKEKTRAK